MITDKEYPATHSMSTAWYMVDADGNVGLMAFDDNGPVPEFNHVEPDLCISDMAFGQGFSEDCMCVGIHLTPAQIYEICGEPRNLNEVDLWFKVILAIDPAYIPEFLLLCENEDITNYGCILPEMNLFYVDAFECIDSNHNIIAESSLAMMLNAGMIKAIYQVPEWDVNSEYDQSAESVVFTKNFENAPYYIYCQSYWSSTPQHRMNVPSTPVNISQIDERFRRKILHVPIRFQDAEDLLIAEWYVCGSNVKVLGINNAGYSLFPINKHTKKYCLTEPFLIDFFEYCPKQKSYKCQRCNRDCARILTEINTLTPTILYIKAPTRDYRYFKRLNLPEYLKAKMALFSYIPSFPHKDPKYFMSIDGVAHMMTVESLTQLLALSKGWFENVVKVINPHVIIIDNEALPVFSEVFPISNNEVTINNSKYPISPESDVMDHEHYIKSLAQQPYRGQIFRMSYTEQEVEELKRTGGTFEPY